MFSKKGGKNNTTLVLSPVDNKLEQIKITTPTFLINRNVDHISKYSDRHPFEVSCLSGNHASITYEKEQYVLQDLGSTNGTLINENKIQGNSVTLKDGDVVTFGNQLFSYRVLIQIPPPKKKDRTAEKSITPPTPAKGTVVIGKSSVDEIINVIVNDSKNESSIKIEDLGGPAQDSIKESPLKKFALPLLGGLAIIVISMGLLVFLYLGRHSEFNKIETLLAEKRYESALQLSSQNLSSADPGSSAASRFENYAQEAFMGWATPDWIESINCLLYTSPSPRDS